MPMPRNTPERLRAKWPEWYDEVDGCHEWSGARVGKGYGKTRMHGRTYRAHRAAYELFVGPIPEGQVVRHTCDNPGCVNPDHLELGTHADNMKDKRVRSRPNGGIPARFPGPDWPIFLRKLNQLGLTQYRLAEKFGTSQTTISSTIRR